MWTAIEEESAHMINDSIDAQADEDDFSGIECGYEGYDEYMDYEESPYDGTYSEE